MSNSAARTHGVPERHRDHSRRLTAVGGAVSDHDLIELIRSELASRPTLSLVAGRVSHLLLAGQVDGDDPILDLIDPGNVLDEKTVMRDAVEYILSFPHLSAGEVAVKYRKTWANPSDALRKRAGQIIGLKQGRRYRYPEFQFSLPEDATELVRRSNVALGAEDDPWGVASWWLSPNPAAAGRPSPVDLLEAGDLEQVAALVRAEVEDDIA
ncbi:hypothetical protein [Rhodococcus daqingensis]|uniref:Antitoxin Xre/MbcA/ParS-like toxin-binding domain-containing protein n=1 Tax=Rhodococcus daqingensis TaxID=2479363 RepID=A0ABW2S1S0_9NOCA